MPRFRRRSVVRSARRPAKWCSEGVVAETMVASVTNSRALCDVTEFREFTQPTVVRIRGRLYCTVSSTGPAASTVARLAMGIIVVDAELDPDAINPADIQGADRPWLWLEFARLGTRQNGAWDSDSNTAQSVTDHAGDHYRDFSLDIKAMRKVPDGSELRLVWRAEAVSATPTVQIEHLIRVLVKE